ncbi:DJ-1/PfpI family protein [Amycolatopsis xylanica]|uniref:DJ-1/PfpI family protein n=1 Tax=Amycolatopsis xylanica TaxID=589385 RepID=A0A1H2SV66_9PSEU|nr:DJ-1/PfpI family protein [Amycolatopsis xylanica]SDW35345.1 DJ-1/PfpI family protein [Amycolatopsis xylanica]
MTDEPKTIAFVLYPGLTLLDLAGPLQVLGALSDLGLPYRAVTVSERKEPIGTDTPMSLLATHTFAEIPKPAAVVVPGGGTPTIRALTDETLLSYLRGAAERAEFVTSVCTGSMILGAAGLLDGREATTHWLYRETLKEFGATPVAKRWVEDGPVITAAGVSAGIDLALHLVGRIAGDEVQRGVQFMIEYDPEPPLGPLDWSAAPVEMFHPWAEATLRQGLEGHPELLARLLVHV